MDMGDVIDFDRDGKVRKNGATIAEFALQNDVLLDEVRAGGRIPLIIGRGLTARRVKRWATGIDPVPSAAARPTVAGLLAGAEDGRQACGLPAGRASVRGTYCEPKMTTVGSQDTTGPMTRDELKDLACLGFSGRPGGGGATPPPIRSWLT